MEPNINFNLAEFLFEISRVIFYVLIILGWILGFYLIIKAYTKRRKRMWVEKQKYTTILIRVPRNNEKGPLSAQLMFASLHGIYKTSKEKLEDGSFQDHISFEMVSTTKYIRFYVYCPVHLKDFVLGQLYAQYSSVEISEVPDYTLSKRGEGTHFVGTEFSLIRDYYYPIKTFANFEVDPLAGITGVLSQVDEGEQIWIQILARPTDDSWQKKAISHTSAIKSGKVKSGGAGIIGKIFSLIFLFFKLLFNPEAMTKDPSKQAKLAGPVEQAVKAIEEKSTKLGFESKIRVVFLSNKSVEQSKMKLQSIAGAFKQFNASNLNGFVNKKTYVDDFEFMNKVQNRSFEEEGYILNIEELASLFHLPTVTVDTPTIDWAGSKKGEPPASLPIEGTVPDDELTVFAQTNFRDKVQKFGIKINDRRRHMYIIGQTGTGKSTMMKNMIIDDIVEGRGVAIIDPHGEFVDSVIDYIPEDRIKDVVYVNPGDRLYSVGFNLLENVDEAKREIVASGMMSIFKKIWEGVWSARMEYIMKNIILALMETPGTTLLSATRMLVDKDYRKMIVDNIKDPVVKGYWISEFEVQAKTNPKFITEAIAPIQNKIGQFLSVPSVRNIVGQPNSTINIKDIMDNKKILLVRVSKGDIGDDNMALLGAMIITKIQLTAMERSNVSEDEMNDFYLYVDEFQNFATNSFATILAEARKYKLNLIVAHQYIAQLAPDIRDSIFGNAGNFIAFRVSVDDAPILKKTFEPVFDENDLVNLSNFQIYTKMMIDNIITPAFSAGTLDFKNSKKAYKLGDKIIQESREKYATPRDKVEDAINKWAEATSTLGNSEGKKGGEGFDGRPATPEQEKVIEKKKGEGTRELRDKTGGIWYARKKAVPEAPAEALKEDAPAPVAEEQVVVSESPEKVPEVIQEKQKEGEILQGEPVEISIEKKPEMTDKVGEDDDSDLENDLSGISLNFGNEKKEEENKKDSEENEIKPGESIEL